MFKYKVNAQNKKLFWFCVCFISTLIISCDDIIEPDLTDEKIDSLLISPGDSVVTVISSQTFSWEVVEGATWYNLQIAKPSFKRIEQLIADTNLTKRQYILNLDPGKYEWRVRAHNSSSQSEYALRRLQIDSTLDLTNQTVNLITPSQSSIINKAKILFRWNKVYNAKEYHFVLKTPDQNGNIVYEDPSWSYDTLTLSNLEEKDYSWGIKAKNSYSQSGNFSIQTFSVDRTPPLKPSLTSPTKNQIITSKNLKLSWKRNEEGSGIYDELYVDMDSLFKGTTAIKLDNSYYDLTLDKDTIYFWKVITVDKAGNKSNYDVLVDLGKFKVE
jgi:hypothetical protein